MKYAIYLFNVNTNRFEAYWEYATHEEASKDLAILQRNKPDTESFIEAI